MTREIRHFFSGFVLILAVFVTTEAHCVAVSSSTVSQIRPFVSNRDLFPGFQKYKVPDGTLFECSGKQNAVPNNAYLYYTDGSGTIHAKKCTVIGQKSMFDDVKNFTWCSGAKDNFNYECTGQVIKMTSQRYVCVPTGIGGATIVGSTGFSDKLGCVFNKPKASGQSGANTGANGAKENIANTSNKNVAKSATKTSADAPAQENAGAAPTTISGRVIDENNEPLTGAEVFVVGTEVGTIAGTDGDFSVTGVSASAQKIQISFMGYKTQTLNISENVGTIQMVPDSDAIEEAVLVADKAKKPCYERKATGVRKFQAVEIEKEVVCIPTECDEPRYVLEKGGTKDAACVKVKQPENKSEKKDATDTESKPKQEKKQYTEEEIAELQKKSDEAHAAEQSTANKLIGAAGIGATGIGTAMVASAVAEQRADDDAERDMRAYLETFRCDYGRGQNIRGGATGIELPGGNDLAAMHIEYALLADKLARNKAALNLRPGIEAEIVIDKADTGLYDNAALGKTSGAYASIARALQAPDGVDAAQWNALKDQTAKQLKSGAITAGVGAGGSLIANMLASADWKKADKDKSDSGKDKSGKDNGTAADKSKNKKDTTKDDKKNNKSTKDKVTELAKNKDVKKATEELKAKLDKKDEKPEEKSDAPVDVVPAVIAGAAVVYQDKDILIRQPDGSYKSYNRVLFSADKPILNDGVSIIANETSATCTPEDEGFTCVGGYRITDSDAAIDECKKYPTVRGGDLASVGDNLNQGTHQMYKATEAQKTQLDAFEKHCEGVLKGTWHSVSGIEKTNTELCYTYDIHYCELSGSVSQDICNARFASLTKQYPGAGIIAGLTTTKDGKYHGCRIDIVDAK